ncbi:NlpC/P60 family protein [Daejeonella rubra]|uniref:NlpC/P60 family protein n=1 Tax=Daejeonella rubra TaxID=990371 RepID=A0A1G9PBS3_9SPHI|nr:C40 family peptidase [Daejeonella rubra]SDL96174.1 NlpC/P60 family protein [Daejeonella rubra]
MIINLFILLLLSSCDFSAGDHYTPAALTSKKSVSEIPIKEYTISDGSESDSLVIKLNDSGRTKADQLVDFAESLKGITYKYGSKDPNQGFDCSGFISYVFNHFDISVPRSSIEFTNFAKEINLKEAKRGDLILFTGTDSTKRVVGHMGIITSNNGLMHEFIHSTSGKAFGVTNTPLNKYYQGRFVKVIRFFRDDQL